MLFNNCQSFKNTSFLKKTTVLPNKPLDSKLAEQVFGVTFFTSQRWSAAFHLETQKKIAMLPFALKRKLAICFLLL